MDFDNIVSTQQIGHNTTEPSVTLQKTLYLLVNNEKKLLKLGVNKIGRSADSDICLTSDAVSYEHAHIECEPDDFTLQDLRSTNGTKRNGKTIKPYVYYELVPNTRLVFGDVEAVFYAIDDDQNQAISPDKSFSLQIDDDIISGHPDESISLLDPNVDVAQIAEIIAPAIESKNVGTPPLIPSGNSSNSKWDELMLPPLDFTEEENPNDKSGSSTESEFDFLNGNSANNPPKEHSNLISKTRMLNIDSSIYDHETQKPSSEEPINHNGKTQNPQTESGKKENIYEQETQQIPPEVCNLRPNIYEQDTEIPSLENKQNIYQIETQNTNTPNSADQSLTDLSDAEVNKKTNDEKFKENTPTNECVNENNLKKKTRKKIKVTKKVDTSDEEEAEETKNVRVKRKQKKHKENNDDNMKIKQTENCKENFNKKVNDILISEENDAIVDKNIENHVADNDIIADSNMSNANDTNSESFIGMIVGKKKRIIESSSSEEDSNASDSENKNEKPASPKRGDRCKNKAPLNSTYDVNVQNSIDELYLNKVNTSITQPEESQFINEVNCTPVKNKEKNEEEEPESQFILSENEEEDDETFNMLPSESQSLLVHEPADVEASSKNTTNYDISEMELESVLDGTNLKLTKVLNQNDKNKSSIVENSSSMFSVSETEIQPDFVEEEDFSKVAQLGKPNEILLVNEDSSTTSDFEVFDVMRKAAENKKYGIEEVLSEKSKNGRKCSPQKAKNNKGIVKKTVEPQKTLKNKKNITKLVFASDHESNSAESDIDTSVAEKSNHDTIQANQTEDSAADAPDDDFFEAATQKAKPSDTDDSFVAPSQEDETDDSFVAPTQKELPDDFFEAATQKISVEPSETDDSFVAPTQKQLPKDFFEAETEKVIIETNETSAALDIPTPSEVPEDFFEAATQKVSIGPSETDDSFVAATQKKLPDDFFEAATQKVSIEPSETDESVVAVTSKEKLTKNFFKGTTRKVTASKKIKEKNPAISIYESESSDEDFFNAATQNVDKVQKINVSTKSPRSKKNNVETLRQCSNESSDLSDDNLTVSKKKILKKGKEVPVKTKKATKNKKDGKKDKIKPYNSPVIPNEERESSDDDFFNIPTQKVVHKRNINAPKSVQMKNKNDDIQRECDVNDHESSDESEDNEKITKKKVNLNKKEASPAKCKSTTQLENEKRKKLVIEKREITRVRKKNPRYDNSPPKIVGNNNFRNEKNLKSKSPPEISESPRKKINIDKNKNITSTESLLNFEENNTPTFLQTTRGCKKTPKKNPIETDGVMTKVDRKLDTANSKNIPTSSNLTPCKNKKSVQHCVENEQPKQNHEKQCTESHTGNLLEENPVKPLRNLRCRAKETKSNSDEKNVDDVDASNSRTKATLSKACPLNINSVDVGRDSDEEFKGEQFNELTKENKLKPLQPSKDQKKIKKKRNNIVKSQFNEETDSSSSNEQKLSKLTSVNNKESLFEHCEMNKQFITINLNQLSEENTSTLLQASKVQKKKNKNDSSESNIFKSGIDNQSRENSPVSPLEENVLKIIQSPRSRRKIKRNDDVESTPMVQNDEKLGTTHFKNKSTPSKKTPVNFEKTESSEVKTILSKNSSELLEEKSSKPLKDKKGRKKTAKDEPLESNVTKASVDRTSSKNRTLPESPVKNVALKLSTSDKEDQTLTHSSLQHSPDPLVVLERLEDTPPRKINSSLKHANLLMSLDTKGISSPSASITRRSPAQVFPSKDKSRREKKPEKSEENKTNCRANSSELIEEKASSSKGTKSRKKTAKDEPLSNVTKADGKVESTKTTSEDKKVEVNSSREEDGQSSRNGKRAKNTREEKVPMKGSPARKKAKKTGEEEESNESLSAVSTAKPRPGRPRKGATPSKAAAKRKGAVTDQGTMKAPSTPKKRKETEARWSSPRLKGNAAGDSVSLKGRASKSCNFGDNVSLGEEGRASRSSSSESANSTTSSERRQKMNLSTAKGPDMKVTFTMIDNVSKYDKLLFSLRGVTTDDALSSDVLVTLKVARSLKFLMFLALGKPIVSVKWLADSERSMRFMPHASYILRDTEAEKRYGFSLAQSIARAKETKLLASYSVHVTDSVKPAPGDMKSIVACAGGTFLSKAPASWPPYSIIVTDPADSKQLKKLLSIPGPKPSVVNKEFILSGILQQKLDFVKHKIKV